MAISPGLGLRVNPDQVHRVGVRAGDAAAPDPLLVELVKLLARAAAERDYMRLCRKDSDGKAPKPQGE